MKTDTRTFVDCKAPRPERPTLHEARTMFDAGEIHERLDAVKSENLKRLDDDIDILKAYLKTQKVPKTVATAFKGLTIEQHVSWKKAVEKIEELLEQPDCAGFRSGGLVAGDQTEITKVCK